MIELQWITNQATMERRLFYRSLSASMDASGALNVAQSSWGPWKSVPELTLDEANLHDLIESGGIVDAP